jgi:hypothetical protein
MEIFSGISVQKSSAYYCPTSAAGVGDDNPKIDRLLSTQLLKVPLLLDPHGSVGFNRHPRVLVSDLFKGTVCHETFYVGGSFKK